MSWGFQDERRSAVPNSDSCLRLIRALAVETHEGWLEEHRYLNMDLLAEHKRELLRRL
jgi:transposase-like protein